MGCGELSSAPRRHTTHLGIHCIYFWSLFVSFSFHLYRISEVFHSGMDGYTYIVWHKKTAFTQLGVVSLLFPSAAFTNLRFAFSIHSWLLVQHFGRLSLWCLLDGG